MKYNDIEEFFDNSDAKEYVSSRVGGTYDIESDISLIILLKQHVVTYLPAKGKFLRIRVFKWHMDIIGKRFSKLEFTEVFALSLGRMVVEEDNDENNQYL